MKLAPNKLRFIYLGLFFFKMVVVLIFTYLNKQF